MDKLFYEGHSSASTIFCSTIERITMQSAKPIIVSLIFCLAIICSGCSEDKKTDSNLTDPSGTTTSPFAGDWTVAFAGDAEGGGTLQIKSDGSFSWIIILSDGVNTFTNTISGSVTSSGSLSGKIFFAGTEIGSIDGNFEGNAGSGTWSTIDPSSGTWSAVK